MADDGNGANRLADHTGDVTGPIDGNRIEWADEVCVLGTYRNAGTTLNTGMPIDSEDHWYRLQHRALLISCDTLRVG